MAVRLVDHQQPSKVIPLHQRKITALERSEVPTPEPAQLYNLIVLAFLLHTGEPGGWCAMCDVEWPCPHLRLAFRLREGF